MTATVFQLLTKKKMTSPLAFSIGPELVTSSYFFVFCNVLESCLIILSIECRLYRYTLWGTIIPELKNKVSVSVSIWLIEKFWKSPTLCQNYKSPWHFGWFLCEAKILVKSRLSKKDCLDLVHCIRIWKGGLITSTPRSV